MGFPDVGVTRAREAQRRGRTPPQRRRLGAHHRLPGLDYPRPTVRVVEGEVLDGFETDPVAHPRSRANGLFRDPLVPWSVLRKMR